MYISFQLLLEFYLPKAVIQFIYMRSEGENSMTCYLFINTPVSSINLNTWDLYNDRRMYNCLWLKEDLLK